MLSSLRTIPTFPRFLHGANNINLFDDDDASYHHLATGGARNQFPFPRSPRIDIQTFSGSDDILNWLNHVEHHFDIQRIQEWDKLTFCKFYLRDDALLWWRWLEGQHGGAISWAYFREQIVAQYGHNELSDLLAGLSNLKQTSNIVDYHLQFNKISHLIQKIEEIHLVSLFLAGLRPEIDLEVMLHKPINIMHTYRLSGAREEIHLDSRITEANAAQIIAFLRFTKFIYSLYREFR